MKNPVLRFALLYLSRKPTNIRFLVRSTPVSKKNPRISTRLRAGWPSMLLFLALPWAMAGERGPDLPPGAPDLVVDPAGIESTSNGLELKVVVTNRGSRPSSATSVRLTDQPPLQASGVEVAAYPRHKILPGERALVIWPEPASSGWRLRVRWRGNTDSDFFSGRLRLEDGDGKPLSGITVTTVGATLPAMVVRDQDWIRWQAATGQAGGGFDLALPAAAAPRSFTLADPVLSGVANVRQVYIGNWWLTRYFRSGEASILPDQLTGAGQVTISLDDPRLAHVDVPARSNGLLLEHDLPPLDPGGQAVLVFQLETPVNEYFVEVDPGDEVGEIREGNNTAVHRGIPRPVMVALHTHASLSEGTASVDAQMDLMSRSGYDAVFWTEHDWRVSGTDYPQAYSFEDQMDLSTWLMVPRRLDPGIQATITPVDRRATHGTRSLEINARRDTPGGGDPPAAAWAFRASRGHHIRSLAQDLSLALDLFPDLDNPFGSEFTIELVLSDQPRVHRRLLYRVETLPGSGAPRQVVLPSPFSPTETSVVIIEPGRWTRIVIPVSSHARALFPEGLDNALTGVKFGIMVHEGAARWNMDNLQIEVAVTGDPLLALQESWTRFYPAMASHVSAEISYYVPHFNTYTPQRFLLDYNTVTQDNYVTAALQETRNRQGALSLNHPLGFGVPYPAQHLEDQFRHRFFGADLLEAGYRFRGGADLRRHLAFWDRGLAEGIPVSGIGVTDAHGAGRGNGFTRDENNFATWLGWFGGVNDSPAVDPSSRDSLIDALLAGRLVFGDPLLFHGALRLDMDQVHGPGAVVMGPARTHTVVLDGEDLPPGGRADLMLDGRVHSTVPIDASGRVHLEADLPAVAQAVRAEVWDARGEPVVFTNAILLLRDLPPEGIPAARLRAETEHGFLTGRGRYRVERLLVDAHGLTLRGSGQRGELRMERAGGEPAVVTAIDSGTPVRWTYDAATDVLTLPLQGSGLNLKWSSPALRLVRSRWSLLAFTAAALGLILWLLFRPRGRRP